MKKFIFLLLSAHLSFAADEVKLLDVSHKYYNHPAPYCMNHVLEGSVEIKNLAYAKLVEVHYNAGHGEWKVARASFDRVIDRFHEVWTFSVGETTYKYPGDGFFDFAIKYLVDGKEYWDNNGGLNYTCPPGVYLPYKGDNLALEE